MHAFLRKCGMSCSRSRIGEVHPLRRAPWVLLMENACAPVIAQEGCQCVLFQQHQRRDTCNVVVPLKSAAMLGLSLLQNRHAKEQVRACSQPKSRP